MDQEKSDNLQKGQTLVQSIEQQAQHNEVDHQNIHSFGSSERQLTMIYPQFELLYQRSLASLSQESIEKIQKWTYNKQKENYLYFVQPQQYIPFTKNLRLQYFFEHNDHRIMNYLFQAMNLRQKNVENDILNEILEVKSLKTQQKSKDSNSQIIQPTPQQIKKQEQEQRKRHQQIVKSHQKERKRIEKLKQKEQQMKKQIQHKQNQQKIKAQQQMKKQHSQTLSKRISTNLEKRQKQIQLISQRNKDYNFILKSWSNNPALYEKMEVNFMKRYQSSLQQDRKKAKSQRSKFLSNSRVEDLNIKQHQNKYLKWKSQSESIRAAKLQEQSRMIEMFQKELQKFKKSKKGNQKDNYDQEGSQDQVMNDGSSLKRGKSYHEVKQQYRRMALEKRRKMETYWENFVKLQKQPQIDPKKQQQLQNLIQSLQKSRRMKKVKKQDGQVAYEQVKPSDPAMKGLQYLEYSRQLGRKRKQTRAKDSHQNDSSVHGLTQRKNHSIDYLKQIRQSRSTALNSSRGTKNKLLFLEKRDLSFHDKLQKVERETFKLQQQTKLSQNQLKYGKFKTSDQILQYKEHIDNNHLEILKMKLLLAAHAN